MALFSNPGSACAQMPGTIASSPGEELAALPYGADTLRCAKTHYERLRAKSVTQLDHRREKNAHRQCQICSIFGRDLIKGCMVVDHNHMTKMIRGWLCDPCNGKLGQYECHTRDGRKLHNKTRKWAAHYSIEIAIHLAADTGIPYGFKAKFIALST
jgi:hypothetical protein